ncbi:MAG TPA: hypothetical protein VJR89_09140 [Polyangiales bacterium]|nr:hypothetical protein [Polyangiales bacterium]
MPCTPVPNWVCENECWEALADTDDACGQCVTDHLTWQTFRGFCNDFECVCTMRAGPVISLEGCAACEPFLRARARGAAGGP